MKRPLALVPSSVLVAACAPSNVSAVPFDPSAFSARANANQQSLYSAIVPKTSAIETVSADSAPMPPGQGWYCYEARTTRFSPSSPKGDSHVSRPCHRTESACRAEADKAAKQKAYGTRERLEVQVTACAPRNSANCTYYWFENGTGGHACAAGAEDCEAQLLAVTTPGSAVKQSACREVR